ncbi:Phosphoserine aminotransferase [Shewanella piezotolerans WP3]|uniref:Phosphoserine aminotransferase n=1 Tax=Shewanella piezotolerans (strain WP3 / JCM 13877) TaxID=225849 RepID=SERC_SHEPW|nr:3-phosphoserine/phosphohydroxythreonine transaminase [Shewanella piezotolerans]B8CMG9.1 RecName: Full=Phosphoserine aminotransferase; AltName: Full=Phosphohydroxythreonine aminotransferase; Short=PSAT [Shewanella piezotolerans WP3]ACJ29226.1 Phosphoserine aminotransferase [Shewanella piezotolerans WP3]
MSATFNFCAGPAMLPKPVMDKAQSELLDWNSMGTSVMEISHRSKEFIALTNQAEADLRQLMDIPANYHVLFMHGGGRGQFSAIANNFLGDKGRALYLVDGSWSSAAVEEAKKLVGEENIDTINIVENNNGINSVVLPSLSNIDKDYRYLHYCPNETVDGIEIFDTINSPWPVIADMSSNILSRKIDVNQFALIYAGAQKNIGPSGLSIVIVRNDMLSLPSLPQSSIMDYKLAVKHGSMYNTPPTFAWYLAAEVFAWLKVSGGVDSVELINIEKAMRLYQCIDELDFYKSGVAVENRSRMNVTFQLVNAELDNQFLEEAKQAGLVALKGHRSVGGMRASIYNAMPIEGVIELVKFMQTFAKKHS